MSESNNKGEPAELGPNGYQIIRAPQELKERCVRPGNASLAALEAIARAESAIEELSVNFESWMRMEVERLTLARSALKYDPAAAIEDLFQAAHDLKGQASTLGYPYAADVCSSLCRLIEAFEDKSQIPVELIDHHVDAVRAVVRETASGTYDETARRLVGELRELTQEIVARKAPKTDTEAA